MKGLLKTKPAGNQLLVLIGIALVSLFFIFNMVGVSVMSAITGIKTAELMDSAKIDFSKPGMITYLRGMQVFNFISLFMVPSIAGAWLFSDQPKKYLGLQRKASFNYWIVGVGVLLIALPLVTGLGLLNREIPFPDSMAKWMMAKEEDAARTFRALLSRSTVQDLIINIICIAGLAAIGEELLFRGMIQRLLIKIFKNPWAGIIATAFLFSAMHLQFYGFIPRFMLGILLGLVYWYSGSLWIAMLAHFVYNGVQIVMVYNNPAMLKDDTAGVSVPAVAMASALSAALVVLAVIWMRKKSTITYTEVYADDSVPVKDHPF